MGIAGAAAAIGAAGSLAAGVSSAVGAGQASGASQQSAGQQLAEWQFAQAQQAPFIQAGAAQLPAYSQLATQGGQYAQQAYGAAANLLGLGGQGAAGAMNQLQQMPGYQFTLQQGLQAAQNQAAAQGRGVSGAAMRAGADYAAGLASQQYQNQLANLLGFGGTQAGYVQNLANLGQTTSVGAGQQTVQAAANQGAAISQAGQFAGQGTQALGQGLQGALNTIGGSNWLNSLLGGSTTGTASGAGGTYTSYDAAGNPVGSGATF